MAEQTKLYLSIACNLIILLATVIIVVSYFFVPMKGGQKPPGVRKFRFFTTDSNLFSALACGFALFYELKNFNMSYVVLPHWVILLKFFSASTVLITFLTVLFYLGPKDGYINQFGGTSFYTHLAGPLLAIATLLIFEKGDSISIEEAFVGLIPFVAYFWVYLRQVVLTAQRDDEGNLIRGWEDFYGFNSGGKWIITTALMTPIILAIVFGLRALYN